VLDCRRILGSICLARNGMRVNRVRRRRYGRKRGPQLTPRTLMVIAGGAVVLAVGGFFYLLNVADGVKPLQQEKRIELPNAFKS
jgi:hypothetical protein